MPAISEGERLHYLDNMRAMAFSMMLLFHTLKLFSPEGWGIHLTPLPGSHLTAEIITNWRLPLLFFISGAAFSISITRQNVFTRTAKKLLPMLIIGTPILVATANYLHERYTNPNTVLWSHFTLYFENVRKGNLSWYHLWYLGYILFFVAVHQLVHDIAKKFDLKLASTHLIYIVLIIIVSLLNEALLRPYFPVRRNFFNDIASLISFACYYLVGAIVIHRRDFLSRNAELVWPLSAMSLLAMVVHFAFSPLPLPITKTIVAWTAIFGLNGLFYRFANVKLAMTTVLHNKLMDIYVIHQLTLLTAVFITVQLTDGLWRICAIFIIGYALAYMAGLAKSYVKFLLKQGISSLKGWSHARQHT
jgi:glucans biosynthesis protein C